MEGVILNSIFRNLLLDKNCEPGAEMFVFKHFRKLVTQKNIVLM